MDRQAFQESYNARIERLGGEAGRLRMLGVVNADGDAAVMNTATPGINVLYFAKDQAEGAVVSGHMNPQSATLAMISYSCCLDVMLRLTDKRRNRLLQRLHLFDGKLRAEGHNLTQGEHMLEVRPGHPASTMISFMVAKGRQGLPAELIKPVSRGI